jgi:RES domain-containing protein
MALSAHLKTWSGVALRHLPAGAHYDVLDFRFAGRGADNRWNGPGVPTLYLAGDEGVLIAEWGRHFAINRDSSLKPLTQERRVFRLELALDQVIDLRQAAVWDELSLGNAPQCFLEVDVARAVAEFIRKTTIAQGMLVPSMGFLDHLDRWCLVVFLEKLGDPKSFISSVTNGGAVQMSDGDLAS